MGRKARLKRERRFAKPGDALAVMRRRLTATGSVVGESDPTLPKISDTLVDFVQPLLDLLDDGFFTRLEFRRLIALGATVWNVTLLPDTEKLLADIRAQSGTHLLLDVLLERRKTDFAHDRRFITDFEVSDLTEDGEFRVSAAYTILGPNGSPSGM
jgi:hypothetical protein